MAVDVLATSPHPDDVEIGAGGTLLKLKKEGYSVAILDLTNGEPTPKGDVSIRMREAMEAKNILGVDERITLDLPNRYLFDSREAREKVAEVIRELKPRIILTPYFIDAHPDHREATKIVEAARFYSKFTKTEMKGSPHYPEKIIYYLASHLRIHFRPSFIVDISEFFDEKMRAILTYRSQFGYDERDEFIKNILSSINGYYGRLIGVRYGEPLFTHEEVGVKQLRGFLLP
jgi:bacillithiol biosynthesis deacetylase BshB1